MSSQVLTLAQTFAVMKPDQRVDALEVTPSIYEQLNDRYDGFGGHTLVAEYAFSSDWSNWERHPAGDETVVLLSGRAQMILRRDGVDESLDLEHVGEYVIIPAGVWHTAKVSSPTRLLFVTPGAGTEHARQP